jgi:hypothetical protein
MAIHFPDPVEIGLARTAVIALPIEDEELAVYRLVLNNPPSEQHE